MQVPLALRTTDFPIKIRLEITFLSLLRYVITILADLVRSEPTYTSSNWRVESTLSDSDTNIASNSLTSSSNVGLCIGDSCQHFNIIWYLRKQEKPKTRTIYLINTTGMSFFLVLPFATCTSPKTHLVCPKILHKHCFQFLLGQREGRCFHPGPYYVYILN